MLRGCARRGVGEARATGGRGRQAQGRALKFTRPPEHSISARKWRSAIDANDASASARAQNAGGRALSRLWRRRGRQIDVHAEMQ